MLMGRPPGGLACGSFGLSRGPVIEPIGTANGHPLASVCVVALTNQLGSDGGRPTDGDGVRLQQRRVCVSRLLEKAARESSATTYRRIWHPCRKSVPGCVSGSGGWYLGSHSDVSDP